MRVKIRCVNKQPQHIPTEQITHIGEVNSDRKRRNITLDEAMHSSKVGKQDFFVSANDHQAEVQVSTDRSSRKYLKTVADDYEPNNLLSLPGCP